MTSSKTQDEAEYPDQNLIYVNLDRGHKAYLLRKMPEDSNETNSLKNSLTIQRKRGQKNVCFGPLSVKYSRQPTGKVELLDNERKQKSQLPISFFGIKLLYYKRALLLLSTLLTLLIVSLLIQQMREEKTLQEKVDGENGVIYHQVVPIKDISSKHTSVMLLGGLRNNGTNLVTIYDSNEKSWKDCGHLKLPSTLAYHGGIILNDELFVFGGYESLENQKPFASLYKLGKDNKWEKLAEMNEMRSHITGSSVVFDSEIWVIGGWNGTRRVKSVEKYNPKFDNWTLMPEMNEQRSSASATIINGKIYVSGGFGGITETLSSVEVYDPAKNKWEIFSELPHKLELHSSIAQHSDLIIIGGRKYDKLPSDEFWKMDVLNSTKIWKKMPNLMQNRFNFGLAELKDGLMAIGGATGINSVEFFDGIKWKQGAKLLTMNSAFATIHLTSQSERVFLHQFCQKS